MDKGGEMKDEIKNLRYELLHVTAERDELQKENEGLKAKEIRGDRMISDLEHQNTVLQKENEGWDQQAQEVERLREALSIAWHNNPTPGSDDYNKVLAALRNEVSPSKDTPDSEIPDTSKYSRHAPSEHKAWTEGYVAGMARERSKSSPVSVDPTIEGDFAMWTKDKLKQWYYGTYIKLDLKFEELKTLSEMEQMIAAGDFEYMGYVIKLASPVSVDINEETETLWHEVGQIIHDNETFLFYGHVLHKLESKFHLTRRLSKASPPKPTE
jgi:hypothetical protein